MRAIEIRGAFGLDNLALAEREEPSAGPGQVVVSMRAASLNYRDLMMVQGSYNPGTQQARIWTHIAINCRRSPRRSVTVFMAGMNHGA